jgi:hypothetical protein
VNVTLVKALVAFVPVSLLFAGTVIVFLRGKTVSACLQLLGAGCLIVVVLTHVAEALHLFSAMQWGDPHSVGHYLDLSSAVLGVTLLPVPALLTNAAPSPTRFPAAAACIAAWRAFQ